MTWNYIVDEHDVEQVTFRSGEARVAYMHAPRTIHHYVHRSTRRTKKSARRSNAPSLSCSQTYNPTLDLVFWKPFAQGRGKAVLGCTIDTIDVFIVSMPVLRVCALDTDSCSHTHTASTHILGLCLHSI